MDFKIKIDNGWLFEKAMLEASFSRKLILYIAENIVIKLIGSCNLYFRRWSLLKSEFSFWVDLVVDFFISLDDLGGR